MLMEDDTEIASLYSQVLKDRGKVTLASTAEQRKRKLVNVVSNNNVQPLIIYLINEQSKADESLTTTCGGMRFGLTPCIYILYTG